MEIEKESVILLQGVLSCKKGKPYFKYMMKEFPVRKVWRCNDRCMGKNMEQITKEVKELWEGIK